MLIIETVLFLACLSLALTAWRREEPVRVRVAQKSRIHGRPVNRGRG